MTHGKSQDSPRTVLPPPYKHLRVSDKMPLQAEGK
jgi:hypothetical protein